MKIGVFDSGIGGITVLTELRKTFPSVSFVYLGDTANLPYGNKSAAKIRSLSCDCARVLKSRKIDALVVACNTASSWAIDALKEVMGTIPIFDVVNPGADAALEAAKTLKGRDAPILVLATRATVASGSYGKSLKARQSALSPHRKIIEQSCPLLVPMIEEGWVDHPILHQTIKEYVKPYLDSEKTGVALLGCTHYPWIHLAFEKAMPGWTIVNSAQAVAKALATSGLPMEQTAKSPPVEWIFTDPDALPAFIINYMDNGLEA